MYSNYHLLGSMIQPLNLTKSSKNPNKQVRKDGYVLLIVIIS